MQARARIVKRREGWFTYGYEVGPDGVPGRTIIGPMSREDACLVRDSFKRLSLIGKEKDSGEQN